MSAMTSKRVAIIGAGPSGTSCLRAFKSAQEKGADIPEIGEWMDTRVDVWGMGSGVMFVGVGFGWEEGGEGFYYLTAWLGWK